MKSFWKILVIILITNCQKSPVGFDELEREIATLGKEILTPKESLSFGLYFPGGDAQFLYLGKNRKYEARVLFSFPLIDSARENVTKITLWLYTQDTARYQFQIYPLTTQWATNATWRMASTDIQWLNPGGDFLNQVLATGLVQKDSISQEIPIEFLDLLLSSTGLILIPEMNPNLNFASFSKIAKLVFTYGDKDRAFLSQMATYLVNFLDTLPSNSFALGSGYVFRTYLFYPFQLEKGYKVAEGEMTITFDLTNSYRLRDTLELAILKLSENFWLRRERSSYEESPPVRKTLVFPRDTIVRLPVKTLLEDWQKEPKKNYGVYLVLYPQYQFPTYLLLKNDSLNFQINLTYLPPVKDRFR